MSLKERGLMCPSCYSKDIIKKGYERSGSQRWGCKSCGKSTTQPLGLENYDSSIVNPDEAIERKKKILKKERWVITSAQNATPVKVEFLNSLRTYCEVNGAELVVIPTRYRNPTSIFTEKEQDWWDDTIVPHLIDRRIDLCDGLTVLADVQVQPTAVRPLTGLEGFTGENSCIVGHPKIQYRSVPTRQGKLAKIMTTTGSVTLRNYTDSKAGKKGEHHHVYGAVIVEHDRVDNIFHIRHINACGDGSFIDLDKEYKDGSVRDSEYIETLTLGDLHQWFVSDEVDRAVFGENGMIDTLNPRKLILHDVIDGYSISHHHRSDPFIKYAKHRYGKNNVLEEIKDFCAYMNERMYNRKGMEVYIIASNHDEHISRYIKEMDWRDDPENAEFYLETALHMIRNTQMKDWGESVPRAMGYWIDKFSPDIKVLGRDESLEVQGVEHGLHGDLGPNGSRGSALNLSRIGAKVTVGHSHSPSILDSVYTAGVSTGRMSYARGPSSWLNTHVVLYKNGKRTLITTIKGKFRT